MYLCEKIIINVAKTKGGTIKSKTMNDVVI